MQDEWLLPMFPADHQPTPLTISYDGRKGIRCFRRMKDEFSARRLYVSLFNKGRNPKVHRSENAMCPEITKSEVVETPVTTAVEPKAPAKVVAKKTVKKVVKALAKPKKESKKAAPKAKKDVAAEYGMEKSHDVPWNEKKVAVIKALKALKAFGAGAARSAKDIAEKSDLTPHDVRHYCYHAKISGLTGIAAAEDIRGYAFYLTAKGQKCDPAAELKAQQSK